LDYRVTIITGTRQQWSVTKKTDADVFWETLFNYGLSLERKAEYRSQLISCIEKLNKEILPLEAALKHNNNSTIYLDDKKPESIGNMLVRAYTLGEEIKTLEEKIDSENRYFNFLCREGFERKIVAVLSQWFELPFKERNFLLHNKKKEGFLITFATFPGGVPDPGYHSHPGLGWEPITNNIIPDLFSKTMPITKYKPRDKLTFKADLDSDRFPYANKCKSCERLFYTFTKTKLYCCDECDSDAYNKRRRNRRHEQNQQPKTDVVKELKHCPFCQGEYAGKGRTCGKERCRKADFRKRKMKNEQ